MKLILQDACRQSDRIFRRNRAIGFEFKGQLVKISPLANACVTNMIGDLVDRREQRIDRDQPDRCIGSTVLRGRHIALSGFNHQLHHDARALVERHENVIGIHDLDIRTGIDLTGRHFTRTGGCERHALGAFAVHTQRHSLHVQHHIRDVFTNTGNGRELMQDTFDLNRCHGRALKRREENATQRISEGQPETTLEWFCNDGCLTRRVQSARDIELVRLDQFGPVLLKHIAFLKPFSARPDPVS